MDPNTGKWERAKVTAVGSAGNEFDVLIDTGECRKGNVRDVCNREVPQLLKMAAQAVQCRLVGINVSACICVGNMHVHTYACICAGMYMGLRQ